MFREPDLFGAIEPNVVSIDDSALRLGVSTATIKNWVKTGYLKQGGLGGITEESLGYFRDEIAGKEKLNQRANKSLKDDHDHDSVSSAFILKAKMADAMCSKLGEQYETSLSDSFRNKEGIYYTPVSVVRELFPPPSDAIEQITFCDPCCGSGNFVIRALELGIKPENVYGYDIDPVAVEITKARIRGFCGYETCNIEKADFLTIAAAGKCSKFDVIFTNPPWGKKLSKTEKERFGERFRAGSSLDTASLFFLASLECLKDDGTLGFLLPEAFFNIATFEDARRTAFSFSIKRLIDFGKPFKGLLTRAQGIVVSKSPAEASDVIKCEAGRDCAIRSTASFLCNPKLIFNLHCDQESADTLGYLFSIPHITLEGKAKWALGIVTGNNQKFISSSMLDGYMPVYKGSDISPSELGPPSSYIPDDLSLYQQVAPRHLYEAKEKLIYKFISSKLCFFHDTHQRFVLNSANLLIPKDDFPVSTKVLGELLNSDFMNWIFGCIFNTAKILRGDLETLPIYSQFLQDAHQFDENSYLTELNIERTPNGTYRIKK
jgi:site-specific DNA-methyltransferase (adenine-specific)